MDYSRYTTLNISHRGPDNSVLDIQMKALNGKLPTAGHAGHAELAEVWRDVSADTSVRCAVLRGEGLGFSGGGDLALVQRQGEAVSAWNATAGEAYVALSQLAAKLAVRH